MLEDQANAGDHAATTGPDGTRGPITRTPDPARTRGQASPPGAAPAHDATGAGHHEPRKPAPTAPRRPGGPAGPRGPNQRRETMRPPPTLPGRLTPANHPHTIARPGRGRFSRIHSIAAFLASLHKRMTAHHQCHTATPQLGCPMPPPPKHTSAAHRPVSARTMGNPATSGI